MATKLGDLMAELSAKDRKEVQARARLHIRAMEDAEHLNQVRKAANKTQSEIAQLMGIGQNAVSQLEGRDDVQLSTLYRYVKSLGLQLELAVVGASGERAVLKNYKPWQAFEAAEKSAPAKSRAHAPKTSSRKVPAGTRTVRNDAVALKAAPSRR